MNYAIILASGSGKRAELDVPKQFVKINGKTILEYSIEKFQNNKSTDRIILVVKKEYLDFCTSLNYDKICKVIAGGKTRQESSFIGASLIEEDSSKVLIHDGARPFVTDKIINGCYSALDNYSAVSIGVETTDTIISVQDNIIVDIPKRSSLLRCQTPQGFRAGLIKNAHKMAKERGIKATDDAGLIVLLNLDKVFVIEGDINNIKITYPKDIEKAKEILL